MTTFEYQPALRANDFVLYNSRDEYANMLSSTTQPYAHSSSYVDVPPYHVTMGSLESYGSMPAYTEISKQPEFALSLDESNAQFGYSPNMSPSNSTSHSLDYVPQLLSNASESGASVSSSAIGSPSLHPNFASESWSNGLGLTPSIVHPESYGHERFVNSTLDQDVILSDKMAGCVDPNLINPFASPAPYGSAYHDIGSPSQRFGFEQPPSPSASLASVHRHRQHGSRSPYAQPFHPYSTSTRRPSVSSIHSRHSLSSRHSSGFELDDDARERGICPYPDCGKIFKDLKAHLLTHQNERPEKCPIPTCDYHIKGFARKYDKNRHTLTHYKGTMVCGFCPGPGSASEKSFNRADVFKRHLTSVHNVEQAPPNSRKRPGAAKKASTASTPETSGTCSTCSVTFANAQEFYEHLDDCVLRVVQQIDPAESINQKNLSAVLQDSQVQDTLDRHHLPHDVDTALSFEEVDEDEEAEYEDDEEEDATFGAKSGGRSGKGTIKGRKSSH